MIFTKARLLLWGGRVLGAGALLGGIWVAGMNFGLDRGYDRAMTNYEKALDEYNKQWYNTVLERDDEWRAEIDRTYSELQLQIEKYQEVEAREKELLDEIAVLESTLNDVRNDYENANFGVCHFSPAFDGVLHNAYEATKPEAN